MPDAAVSPSVTQPPTRLDAVLSGNAQQALSSAQTNRQEFQKTIKEEILPELRAGRQAAEGLKPPAPPPMQPPPEVQPRGQGDAWGSLAMAVAMFGSAFTRQPLTNALNAGAAVNNAFKKQDADAARQALDQWKAHSDYAIKLHDFQYQAYRDALSKIGQDRAGTLAELQVLAAAFKDDGLSQLLQAGQVAQIGPHIDYLKKQNEKLGNETETENQLKQLRIEALDAQKKGDTEGERHALEQINIVNASRGKGGAAAAAGTQPTLDSETIRTMADQYLAGDRSVMQNLGRGAQGANNIVALRAEISRQMSERGMSGQDMATKLAEFEGLKAGERTLTQRTANIGMRIAEAKTFAPLALAASEKVDRTQFPTLNSLLLAAEKGTGDENVIRLSVATQSLLNAYAAAVTPTGTPTEGAQSRAHELLDKAYSQGQFRVAVDQLMKEMEAASKSPGMVREEFRRGADPQTGAAAPSWSTGSATGPNGEKIYTDGKGWFHADHKPVE
jgi:hypothetical protein